MQVESAVRTETGTATGAEVLLRTLVAEGVRCIFANLGTDYPAVVEAFARARAAGEPLPDVILCPHEIVAAGAAQGFAQVTRRPQAAFVHVDVGTANLGGAVHNAARSRTPVLLFAGQSPWTTRGELPGSRTSSIQFVQDVPDQIGIVRGYVKWSQEVRTPVNLRQVVRRALQVARAEPAGPVYLMAAREPLEMTVAEAAADAGPDRAATLPAPSRPDDAALRRLADWLAEAERPLVVTGYLGRNPAAVEALVALAEQLTMPVVEANLAHHLNFPRDHPLHAGGSPGALVPEADLILVIDCDVPWLPAVTRPAPGARIAHLDLDAVKPRIPLADVPADLRLEGDAERSLRRLAELLPAEATRPDRLAARQAWASSVRAARERRRETLLKSSDDRITAGMVAEAIGRALPEAAIVLDESVTNAAITLELTRRRQPGTYLGSGGSSLGWGLGAAIGVKLAAPDRDVVLAVGDGSYIFGVPSAAYWVARRYRVPFVTVIYNNAGWGAVRGATLDQHPDGWARRTGDFSASFDPPADLGQIAAANGAWTERVTDPADLDPALQRALAQTRQGRAAVLDVIITPI